MSAFEEIIEKVKREFVENGVEPPPHVILVKDGKPLTVFVLRFSKEAKPTVFHVVLPHVIRTIAPEACIFVLPSIMRTFDEKTGKAVNPEDVVIVHEVTPTKVKVAIIRKNGEVWKDDDKKVDAPLLRSVQEALREVYIGVV